nr:restriction endonuclease subunit S [Desulfobulbaceae bacterium]
MKFIPITDICDFQGGTQPPKHEWSEKPLGGYVRMLQIRDFTQPERTTPEFVKLSQKLNTCSSDDVLIGRYGASVGKILMGLSGAYNVAIIKTIPDEKKITKPFLYYLLKGPVFQNFIANVGARAAQAGFNKTDLAKFKIPLLSLDDQSRIAHLLGKVEELIVQRKLHLQHLNDLLKSIFLEMFGDPVRNEKGWETRNLTQIVLPTKNALKRGPFGGALKKEIFVESGYLVYEQYHE